MFLGCNGSGTGRNKRRDGSRRCTGKGGLAGHGLNGILFHISLLLVRNFFHSRLLYSVKIRFNRSEYTSKFNMVSTGPSKNVQTTAEHKLECPYLSTNGNASIKATSLTNSRLDNNVSHGTLGSTCSTPFGR